MVTAEFPVEIPHRRPWVRWCYHLGHHAAALAGGARCLAAGATHLGHHAALARSLARSLVPPTSATTCHPPRPPTSATTSVTWLVEPAFVAGAPGLEEAGASVEVGIARF